MRKNDHRVIQAAAEAARLSTAGFTVELEHGVVLVNHPDSMKWSPEMRSAITDAVKHVTGMNASIT